MEKLIRLAILGLLCCVLFLGCSDNQVSVDSYFSSLTNEGNFIFASKYFLIFDGRTKEDFYYDGNKLRIIMLSDEGAYACPDSSSSSEIDLFLISYDDFSVEKINTVTLPGSFIHGGHIGNELYFMPYVKSADRNGKAYYRQYRTIQRTRLDGSFCACYDVEILKNRLFSCDFSVKTGTKISRQYTHANCAVLPILFLT